MSEIRTAEIGGIQWWGATRQFTSANHAAVALKRLNDYGQKRRGDLQIGSYRHMVDDEGNYITVVGHKLEGVEKALEILEGEPYRLHPELLTRLVLRRARVLNAMLEGQAPAGVYRFPHPGGVRIDERGNADG